MVIDFKDISVNVVEYGKGNGRPILLLHGWGCDGHIYDGLVSAFPEKHFVVIDFPPFGESGQASADWSILTYAQMVIFVCENLNISKCELLAHSFGCRVAIVLAALRRDLVESIIFTGPAGMKPRFSIKKNYKLLKYKCAKRLNQNLTGFGSEDYKKLSENMKKVFIRIVNEHLEAYCQFISAKTLIIEGHDDKETPPYMAKKLNRLIKKSSLVVIEGGHFAFTQHPLKFYKLISNFWEGL